MRKKLIAKANARIKLAKKKKRARISSATTRSKKNREKMIAKANKRLLK